MAAIAALALVVAACSSEGDGEAATTTSTTTTAPSAITTVPATTSTSAGAGATTTTVAPAETTTTASGPVATATTAVVQEQLTALGYFDGDADGVPGPVTVTAIETFQTDAEITVDGEYGPETAAALAVAVQENPEFVTEVQEDLMEIGLYPGPADGDYGKGTVAAVERLQAECELEVDGMFTVRTQLCLIDQLAETA
jgi:peptidoglycan hydrolase-like protein with peptidoglycan-binding domain